MITPLQAIEVARASGRPTAGTAASAGVLVAGAAGTLGNEVLHRLAAASRHARVQMLVREAMRTGLRGVHPLEVTGDDPEAWPLVAADAAVVLFEPPRAPADRERALWTPRPADLLPLARWLHRSGVATLAVVLPHDQGRLPDALRHGLANLDEQGVAMLGFERLLIVRSARPPEALAAGASPPQRLAHAMLSIFKYMLPEGDKPVRPQRLAEVIDAALAVAPAGVQVLGPELLSQAAAGDAAQVLRQAWQSTAKSRPQASA